MCKGKRKSVPFHKSAQGTLLRPQLQLRNLRPSLVSAGLGHLLAKAIDCAEVGGLKETHRKESIVDSWSLQLCRGAHAPLVPA